MYKIEVRETGGGLNKNAACLYSLPILQKLPTCICVFLISHVWLRLVHVTESQK